MLYLNWSKYFFCFLAFFSTVDKINEQFQKVLDNDSNKDALSRDQFGALAAEYGKFLLEG